MAPERYNFIPQPELQQICKLGEMLQTILFPPTDNLVKWPVLQVLWGISKLFHLMYLNHEQIVLIKFSAHRKPLLLLPPTTFSAFTGELLHYKRRGRTVSVVN